MCAGGASLNGSPSTSPRMGDFLAVLDAALFFFSHRAEPWSVFRRILIRSHSVLALWSLPLRFICSSSAIPVKVDIWKDKQKAWLGSSVIKDSIRGMAFKVWRHNTQYSQTRFYFLWSHFFVLGPMDDCQLCETRPGEVLLNLDLIFWFVKQPITRGKWAQF